MEEISIIVSEANAADTGEPSDCDTTQPDLGEVAIVTGVASLLDKADEFDWDRNELKSERLLLGSQQATGGPHAITGIVSEANAADTGEPSDCDTTQPDSDEVAKVAKVANLTEKADEIELAKSQKFSLVLSGKMDKATFCIYYELVLRDESGNESTPMQFLGSELAEDKQLNYGYITRLRDMPGDFGKHIGEIVKVIAAAIPRLNIIKQGIKIHTNDLLGEITACVRVMEDEYPAKTANCRKAALIWRDPETGKKYVCIKSTAIAKLLDDMDSGWTRREFQNTFSKKGLLVTTDSERKYHPYEVAHKFDGTNSQWYYQFEVVDIQQAEGTNPTDPGQGKEKPEGGDGV
ncbi:hypothetical protein LJC04_02115 [Ruminococcaceae bacterium OttesenSCG-928-O06]|nr:hypothetical protein [Ruminococcaceae bacterium OttesenSCG-928-O06]